MASTLTRLKTQQRLGVAPLSPAESGFLSALRSRDTDPADAVADLSAFLDVFDQATSDSDDSAGELVRLARRERERLENNASSGPRRCPIARIADSRRIGIFAGGRGGVTSNATRYYSNVRRHTMG